MPSGSDNKESAYSARDPGLIPGPGDPLKKAMAPHSSILAQRIPQTEGPGGLTVRGLQRALPTLSPLPATALGQEKWHSSKQRGVRGNLLGAFENGFLH